MSKVAKSFRLNQVAVDYLEELVALTGSSQAAIIEQALAVHRSLLLGGLAGPRRILASTTPANLRAADFDAGAKTAKPKRPASQHLSEARGAARRTLSREASQEAAQKPSESGLGTYKVKARGNIYAFPFPINTLPAKGSMMCPCGSGKIFARCHSKEFQKAVKAGITTRG